MDDSNNDTLLLPPISWEYLAGFFDGEGCIYYAIRPHKTTAPSNYCFMSITQSEKNNASSKLMEQILDFLLSHGIRARIGHYNKHYAYQSAGETPVCVVVASSGACVRDWLNGMMPYLRIKREKAKDALEFLQTKYKFVWTSPQQIEQILSLGGKNIDCTAISNILNIQYATVRNVLKRHHAWHPRPYARTLTLRNPNSY